MSASSKKEKLVSQVVWCLKGMGATPAELIAEREKLSTDDMYLEGWVESIDWTRMPKTWWQRTLLSLRHAFEA